MLIGNPMIFRHWPLEEALRKMLALGYQGIEIWPPQIEACKTDDLRRQFAEHVASLGLSLQRLNTAAADYFVPLRSPGTTRQIVLGLQQDIDIAYSLGMRQLLTWEGRRPASATATDIHGWILDETVSVFREVAAYAQAKGIAVSVEVHPFTLGMDLDFLVALCDRVGSSGFGVTYDCCHFGVGMPEGYAEAIDRLGSRIHNVHFSDSDQVSSELHFPPGKGCLDLAAIVAALKRIGYRGTMMLDLWLYPLPEEGSRIGVPYVRNVLSTLGLTN